MTVSQQSVWSRAELRFEQTVTTTTTRQGNLIADQEYSIIDNVALLQYRSTDEEGEEMNKTDLEILRNATCLKACSDGSYDPISSKAAFNWRVITDAGAGTGLTDCSAPVNTNPKYMNSYRAEYAGLRSLVRYIKKQKLHTKEIIVYCDNKACVDELNKPASEDMTELEKSESDIIRSIKTITKDFQTLEYKWVRSHRDDNDGCAMEDRPIEVQLNIACDTAAKECMRRCIKPTKRSQPLEGAGATLYFGNSMVTTNMKEQIQYAAQVPQMKKYVQSRLKCKDGIVEDINWSAIGRAKGRLTRHQSTYIENDVWMAKHWSPKEVHGTG